MKKDSRFKAFAIKSVHNMIKDEINIVVHNLKFNMSSSKISPNIMEEFSMLTVDIKHVRSMPILQSLLKALSENYFL